jgi:hypothetical protein
VLRLIERVLGEGDLVRDGRRLLRAGYELSLYQQWTDQHGTLTAGRFEVDGHLIAPATLLEPTLGTLSPATLHLDDGRRVDIFVLNADGMITGADDRGFHRG